MWDTFLLCLLTIHPLNTDKKCLLCFIFKNIIICCCYYCFIPLKHGQVFQVLGFQIILFVSMKVKGNWPCHLCKSLVRVIVHRLLDISGFFFSASKDADQRGKAKFRKHRTPSAALLALGTFVEGEKKDMLQPLQGSSAR